MSDNVRFHSKAHAKAHHTGASAGYHDSASDPMASAASPFIGDFHLSGCLVSYDSGQSQNVCYDNLTQQLFGTYTHVKTNSGSWLATGNSKWTVTGSNLYSNDLTQNIGIGTNVAGEKLTVSGNISASGALSTLGALTVLGGTNYFDGNVGIGTNNPGAKLQVSRTGGGNVAYFVSDSTSAGIQLDANSKKWDIFNSNGVANQGFGIYDRTNTVYRLAIDGSNGNVGIGTTAPAKPLHVESSASGYMVEVHNTRSSTSSNGVFIRSDNNSSSSYPLFVQNGDNDYLFLVQAAGNIGIGTAAPNHELTVVGDISATGTIHGTDNIPTGGIMPYAGSTAPVGWLLCDGSTVSSTTYNALYIVVGTTYGGDATNFALPDLRGRMIAGVDAMNNSVGTGGGAASRLAHASTLAAASGTYTETLSSHQIPGHTHEQVHGYIQNSAASAFPSTGNYGGSTFGGGTPDDTAYRSNTFSTGGDKPHNNMPPYLCLNYIIKT